MSDNRLKLILRMLRRASAQNLSHISFPDESVISQISLEILTGDHDLC